MESWKALVKFTHDNGAKIFVGTQITCSEEDDERDWAWTKELMQMLGREHIMGVSIGHDCVWPGVRVSCVWEPVSAGEADSGRDHEVGGAARGVGWKDQHVRDRTTPDKCWAARMDLEKVVICHTHVLTHPKYKTQ